MASASANASLSGTARKAKKNVARTARQKRWSASMVAKLFRPTQFRLVESTLKLVNARTAEAEIGMKVNAKKPNSHGAMNRYPIRLRRQARRRALAAAEVRDGARRAMSWLTLAIL